MTGRFDSIGTPLTGLTLLQRRWIGDSRGYLERLFCLDDLRALLSGATVAQINHTFTERTGTLRGMHFQYPPHAEIKIISCLRGEVFDVAVDLRATSSTFLQWHGEVLSADNHRTLLIPEGFAHGFQTLTDDCELLYFHTAPYHAHSEGGVNALDPRLAIKWPLPVVERSERDTGHPLIDHDFIGATR